MTSAKTRFWSLMARSSRIIRTLIILWSVYHSFLLFTPHLSPLLFLLLSSSFLTNRSYFVFNTTDDYHALVASLSLSSLFFFLFRPHFLPPSFFLSPPSSSFSLLLLLFLISQPQKQLFGCSLRLLILRLLLQIVCSNSNQVALIWWINGDEQGRARH